MVDVARLTANVEVKGAREAAAQLETLNRAGAGAASALGKVESAGAGIGATLTRISAGAVSTAAGFALFKAADAVFSATGDAVIGLNAQLEQAAIGFETMTGSAEGAQQILAQLKAFTVQTPFEFPDLVRAAQRMGRFGVETEKVIPILTALGDAMSAGGTIGAEALDRATLAIAQMSAKTRVMTQEMNQLTEAGIPAWDILAKAIGVSVAELQKMVEKGLVPADKAIDALTTGLEDKFGGQMQRASQTFQGAMSNISDATKLATAQAFRPAFQAISDLALAISTFVQGPQFQQWAAVAERAIGAVTDALRDLVHGDFDQFGAKLADMARTAAAALLHLVNAAIPVVIQGISALGDLAQSAAVWGANLAVEYARGLVEGARTAIVSALNAIGELIMSFFAGHSPPPKGPLHTIDTAGTLLINTYLGGMTKADFGILDKVTATIRDVLEKQVSLGAIGQEGLIPALLGGQAAVASAISQLHEFGSVSEETFQALRDIVGLDADAVIDLFQNMEKLAGLDREIAGLNASLKTLDGQTRDLERSARAVTEKYRDQENQLERALSAAERLYDTQIRASKTLISQLERQIQLREKELGLSVPVSDEEARLKVDVARDNLAKSEAAAAKRRADILEDIAKIQADINEESAKGGKGDPRRMASLQNDLAKANLRLQTEGVQTAEDQLRIEQDRRGVLQAEADLRKQTDPNLKTLNDALATEKERLSVLQAEKDQAVEPIKAQLEDIKQARDAELLVINQQLSAIQDQRAEIQSQISDLNDQRDKIQEIVDTTTARLDHEREVASLLREQADLLDRMAESAAGGAGAKGVGGIGAGALAGIKAPAALDLSGQKPIEVKLPKLDFDEEKKKLEEQIRTAVHDAVTAVFRNPTAIGLSAGALAGAIIGLFTPVGPLLGAGIGAALGVAFVEGFKQLKTILQSGQLGFDEADVESAFVGLKAGATAALKTLAEDVKPILEDFAAFAKREFATLQEWWDKNGDNVVKAAKNVATAIVVAIDVGLKLLRPVLKLLEDNWDTTFKQVLAVVGVLAAALAGDFSGIKKIVADLFGGIVQVMAPAVAELTKLAEQILPKIPPAFEAVSTFVTDTLVPALQKVGDFIGDTLVPALQKGADFVTDTLIPVLKDIGGAITDDVLPPMNNVRDFVQDQLVPGFQKVSDFITETLIPAFGDIRDFITNELIPKFQAGEESAGGLRDKFQVVSDFATQTLLPAIRSVTDFLTNVWNGVMDAARDALGAVGDKLGDVGGKLSEIWQKAQDVGGVVKSFITDRFGDLVTAAGNVLDKLGGPLGLIKILADLLLNVNPLAGAITAVASGIDAMVGAIGRVLGPLGTLIGKMGELKNAIPDKLLPGSPPPLAQGLDMVAAAAAELAGETLNLALALDDGATSAWKQAESLDAVAESATTASDAVAALAADLAKAQAVMGGAFGQLGAQPPAGGFNANVPQDAKEAQMLVNTLATQAGLGGRHFLETAEAKPILGRNEATERILRATSGEGEAGVGAVWEGIEQNTEDIKTKLDAILAALLDARPGSVTAEQIVNALAGPLNRHQQADMRGRMPIAIG